MRWVYIAATLLLGAHLASAASPCSSPVTLCAVSVGGAGTYAATNAGLASAIADASTYRETDAAHCVTYLITIQADIAEVVQVVPKGTCAAPIEIRGPGVSSLVSGSQPVRASSATVANTKKLSCPVDGLTTFMWTTEAGTSATNKVQQLAFRGLEFTGKCRYGYIYIGNGGVGSAVNDPPAFRPAAVTIDRVYMHNPCDVNDNCSQYPIRHVTISANGFQILNSTFADIGPFLPFNGDSQAIYISQATGGLVKNNAINDGTEGSFLENDSSGVQFLGNYYYKNPKFRWTYATNSGAPPDPCYTGERYADLAQTMDGSINGVISNNGSGAERVTKAGHGYTTGDVVIVPIVTSGLYVFAETGWTITVIDANTFDLDGSTYTAAASINVVKLNTAYVCGGGGTAGLADGTWSTTTTKFGAAWGSKNQFECKGCTGIRTIGNYFKNLWYDAQYRAIILNNVDGPMSGEGYGNWLIANTEFFGNRLDNVRGFFAAGGFIAGMAHGPSWINVHDNVVPNVGAPFSAPGVTPGFGETQNDLLTDFTTLSYNFKFEHNTTLIRDAASFGNGQQYLFRTNEGIAAAVSNSFNIGSLGDNQMLAFTSLGGAAGSKGLCSVSRTVGVLGFQLTQNILSGVAGGSSPALSDSVATACASVPPVYPTDHSYIGSYTGTFTNIVSGDPTLWNYAPLNTWAAAYHAAPDGSSLGADTLLVTNATAGALSGAYNAFLEMRLSMRPTAATTATAWFVAPDTGSCTLTISANQDYSSPVFTSTTTGNRARTISITGLTTQTRYRGEVVCGSLELQRSALGASGEFTTP